MATNNKFSTASKLVFTLTLTFSSIETIRNLDITWQTTFNNSSQILHIISSQSIKK